MLLWAGVDAAPPPPPPSPPAIVVAADRDDDDADGKPDAEQDFLPPAARADVLLLDKSFVGAELRASSGGDRARLVVGGRAFPWGRPLPAGAGVQGLAPGVVSLSVTKSKSKSAEPLSIVVVGAGFRDGKKNNVDLVRDHASLERTPPERVEGAADSAYSDPDALRVVVAVPSAIAVGGAPFIGVETLGASGARLDELPHLLVEPVPCAPSPVPPDTRCFASAPVRFVVDDVDRRHPVVEMRSVRAEVGGGVVVRWGSGSAAKKLAVLRVGGPRATPVGPIVRLRATLRPMVVRIAPGGAPAIGGHDAGAIAQLRTELALASAIWGQCGVTFGPAQSLDVKVVDPPPPHLVAFGDDLGLPATGGEVRLPVDGKLIQIPTAPGSTTDRVAYDFAQAATKAGLVAVVSPNVRIAPGASGSVDVSLRKKDGALATAEPAEHAPLSTDPTMNVRIGSVDFSDGLQHFGDMDSMAGTIEERTLVKAYDDGDPATIEIIVIPGFAGGGRIGESFIASDASSIRNVVLLDRAGVRARRSSLTLAHELGHVFMNMPGHPDDYGIDTPTLLMDSDASDASAFGPRRLTVEECARVVREGGPHAKVPLFSEWPLGPLPGITAR